MEKYISKVTGHALVLGGSGGIGSEIVKALVANGAKAISFTYGGNKAKAESLAEELTDIGVKVYFEPVDQLNEPAFKQFLEDAVSAVGEEVSVAVNSIGISPNIELRRANARRKRWLA